MKYLFLIIVTVFINTTVFCQTLTGPQGYKVIDLGTNNQGDYTQSLILLHEIYNGTTVPFNNTVGTFTAFRGDAGAFNRTNIAYVNSSSAYNGTYGYVQSISSDTQWKLKTCVYNGKAYLALDIPYSGAYQNHGFQFAGWANSSAESLKVINYMVNGQPVNQNILSNIQDFTPNLPEIHGVPLMAVTGNLGVGTTNPDAKLTVNGAIHATSVKVDLAIPQPDYVFDEGYKLPTLKETEDYIAKNHHLKEIPSAKDAEQKGIDLGEMNQKLLKKVEELTLYLIEKDKYDKRYMAKITKQQTQINRLKKQIETLSYSLPKTSVKSNPF